MQKLVTVITPCYNAEKFIGETIESVLNQTYGNWEMLVIDDSSTDRSAEIVLGYAARDPRIRYFKTDHPSGSPSLPRNIGIENARGEYLAFLDADDIWLPGKLEKQVSFMEKNGVNIAYSYYEKMASNGERKNRVVKTRKVASYNSLLLTCSIPCLTSIVSRESVGDLRFKPILQEDYCFWLDLLKKGYKAYNICEVTSLYRDVDNSRSANKIVMLHGHWKVLREHQKVGFLPSLFYMATHTFRGFTKSLI